MKVVITGANRGIGLELAKQYLYRGDTVFATVRRPDQASELQALGIAGDLVIVPLDLTDDASIRAAVERIGEKTDRIDLLINNAGIWSATPGDHVTQTFGELTAAEGEGILRTNTVAPLLVTQACLQLLKASSNGTIVSISSGYGSVAQNYGFPLWYSTSKAALNMAMRSVAAQLANDHIVVVVLSPGWVRTDMGGPDATLTPQESVRGLIRVISELGPNHTGKFLNHLGREQDW